MTNTKQKIIKIAEKLFAKQGFEQTSMREIAEEVGVSKANLYHHFSSKTELLKTIMKTAFDDYKHQIDTIVDENKQPKAKIKSAIISYLELCASHKHLVQLIAREDIKRNEDVKKLVMEVENGVRSLWKSLLEGVEFKEDYKIDVFVELFMSMIDSFVIKKYVLKCKETDITPEELADHILYLFLKK